MVGLYFRDFFPEDFLVPKFRTLLLKNFFSENLFSGDLELQFRAIFKKHINCTLVWEKA